MMNDVDSQGVNEHHCINCGYTWTSRRRGFVPKECPNCKSRKWRGAESTAVPAPVEPVAPVVRSTESSHNIQLSQPTVHEVIHSDDEDGTPSEFIPDKYHINEE